jgi:hypothetical protein
MCQGEAGQRWPGHHLVVVAEVEETEDARGHDAAGFVADAADEAWVEDVAAQRLAGRGAADERDGVRTRDDLEEDVKGKRGRRWPALQLRRQLRQRAAAAFAWRHRKYFRLVAAGIYIRWLRGISKSPAILAWLPKKKHL